MEQNKLDFERNSIDILRNFIEIQTLELDSFRLVPSCEFVRTSPEFNRKSPKKHPEFRTAARNTNVLRPFSCWHQQKEKWPCFPAWPPLTKNNLLHLIPNTLNRTWERGRIFWNKGDGVPLDFATFHLPRPNKLPPAFAPIILQKSVWIAREEVGRGTAGQNNHTNE